MKQYKITFLLVALILQGLNLSAQEQMTLQRCREMALQHNEDIRIAGRQLEKATAEREAVKTHRLPRLSASGTGVYLQNEFDRELTLPTSRPNLETGGMEPNIMINHQTGESVIGPDGNPVFNLYAWMPLSISLKGAYMAGVMLEQAIYAGGKINAGNEMAKIGMHLADENIGLQKTNTLVQADQAYWNFVSVGEKVRLAQQAVDMFAEVVDVVQNSVDVGMVHNNELLKAQLEYNNALLGLREAQNGLELSRMNLCRITGLPSGTQIMPLDTLIVVEKPMSRNEEAVISNRPEYRLLEKNLELHDQQIRMARADFLPTAGIQAGYSYIGGIEFGPEKMATSGLSAIASVKIPIFHWGEGVKKIKSARIDKEISELEFEKNKQLMHLEMEQAKMNLQMAYERIGLSEQSLEQAAENMRITRDNYEVGMETLTEYLTSQTRWQEAYSNVIDAKARYRIQQTAWMKASGQLDYGLTGSTGD